MDIKIRKIEKKDHVQVIELINNTISPFIPPLDEYDTIWENFTSQNNVYSLVACIDDPLLYEDTVVGYYSMTVETKIRGGKMAHLEEMAILPECQRQGIGIRLHKAMMDLATQLGCYKVGFHGRPHNAEWYVAIGFGQAETYFHKFLD